LGNQFELGILLEKRLNDELVFLGENAAGTID
jgi:hypothetical protein